MRRALTAAVSAALLAAPAGNAAAVAARVTAKTSPSKAKKKVVTVTRKVTGAIGSAGQWGDIQVVLVVRKTTTIVGKRKRVVRKITNVRVPLYPDHTDRSIYISQQALPWLAQEVLQAQMSANIDMVSGATFTSQGFIDSLQAAILKARQV